MLPVELTERAQWVVAGIDKRPFYTKGGALIPASVTDRTTWMTFAAACEVAGERNLYIGYMTAADDPYVCIDFDVKDADSKHADGTFYQEHEWTPQQVINLQDAMLNDTASYKELSLSGKGAHLWIKGTSGPGVRRGGVEVYSREHFILCTGKPFIRIVRSIVDNRVVSTVEQGVLPVTEQNEFLRKVLEALKQDRHKVVELVEVEPVEEDSVVISRAMGAANKDKFILLCQGRWQEMGYPSQSEADLSLMSMIAFYSKSNVQCRRIFRLTELGKRDKAVKNNVHLNRCLVKIRSRQADEEIANTLIDLSAMMERSKTHDKKAEIEEHEPPEDISGILECSMRFDRVERIEYPPGVLGEICEYMFNAAPRPVKEIAIVAGLGLMAGVTGKAYHLPQTGLNLYIILIAQSAVGKEAMHNGISYLVNHVERYVPGADKFAKFTDFVSGPALVKSFMETPSFVNVVGEIGRKIAAMGAGYNPAMQTLRTQLINLYQKSAPGSSVGSLAYSDKDKNVDIKGAVAYSLIGETTPGTLYDALTEDMMEDGFLSRFSLIQYHGERVPLHYGAVTTPPASLLQKLVTIFSYSMTGNADRTDGAPNSKLVHIRMDAWMLQWKFNVYCDKKINSYVKESQRQMWNRSHLKALRIAGVIAACDDPVNPVVTLEHMKWAINLVLNDVLQMGEKLDNGDIGSDDDIRTTKIKNICKQYLSIKSADAEKAGVTYGMISSSIIPRKYLQMRTCKLSAFNNHKNGSTFSLNLALQSLIDDGHLVEQDKTMMLTQFGPMGKCYKIVKL